MELAEWQAHEARIDADQISDARPLLDRLPASFLESLSPLDALALVHDPRSYLRARQLPPPGDDWLTWALVGGRGAGKSYAAAGWVVSRILEGTPDKPADYMLVAPSLQQVELLQWDVIASLLPPWVRAVPRLSHQQILFPDQGVRLLMHSAENTQARGYNARGAWVEEPVAFPGGGAELWRNLRRAVRVAGSTPARVVLTTTPPRELDSWLLELFAQPSTKVTRCSTRDNPAIDSRNVDAWYAEGGATIDAARDLDGQFIFGADGALFKLEDLEAARVQAAPPLTQIVVAVDPAQSSKKDADLVGIVALGIGAGGLYVLASCSERLEPSAWATRAIEWAEKYRAGRFVVEPTGSGSYPRATLDMQMRLMGASRRPIIESKARGSKADRAAMISVACAAGRLRLVGRHPQLERELTTWHPGANWSPGGLDALVHGAATLTNNGITKL